jgi:hypothetical protein
MSQAPTGIIKQSGNGGERKPGNGKQQMLTMESAIAYDDAEMW